MIFCPYISMRMGSLESERDYWKRESDRLYQVAKSEHIRSTIRFEIIQKHGLINEMRVAMGLEPHPSFDLAEESQPRRRKSLRRSAARSNLRLRQGQKMNLWILHSICLSL